MDPLAAALAIPASIKAALDVADRLRKTLQSKDAGSEEDTKKILAEIISIKNAIRDFSFVTADLRPWKYAHHCTNIIIHTEMTVLFKSGRDQILNDVVNDPRKISIELDKSDFLESSRAFILSRNASELDLQLPQGLERIVGSKTWYDFILMSFDELKATATRRNAKGFFDTLSKFKDLVQPLNHTADNVLLKGLDKIADRLDQIRSQLPDAPQQ